MSDSTTQSSSVVFTRIDGNDPVTEIKGEPKRFTVAEHRQMMNAFETHVAGHPEVKAAAGQQPVPAPVRWCIVECVIEPDFQRVNCLYRRC